MQDFDFNIEPIADKNDLNSMLHDQEERLAKQVEDTHISSLPWKSLTSDSFFMAPAKMHMRYPLHAAALSGNIAQIKNLITKENVFNLNDSKQTILHILIQRPVIEGITQHAGLDKIINYLVNLVGINTFTELANIQDNKGKTFLHYIIINNKKTLFRYVLNKLYTPGMNLALQDIEGNTVMHTAAIKLHEENRPKAFNRLYRDFSSLGLMNIKNNQGKKPLDLINLHAVCLLDDEKLIDMKIKQKAASVYEKDKDGKTPLHWAAEQRREKAFKILINAAGENKFNYIIQQDCYGKTVLHYCIESNKLDFFHIINNYLTLLPKEKQITLIEKKDTGGNTVAHYAAKQKRHGALEAILRLKPALYLIPNKEFTSPRTLLSPDKQKSFDEFVNTISEKKNTPTKKYPRKK